MAQKPQTNVTAQSAVNAAAPPVAPMPAVVKVHDASTAQLAAERIGTLYSSGMRAVATLALAVATFLSLNGPAAMGYAIEKDAKSPFVLRKVNGRRVVENTLAAGVAAFNVKAKDRSISPEIACVMALCADGGEPASEQQARNLMAYGAFVSAAATFSADVRDGKVSLPTISDVASVGVSKEKVSALCEAVRRETQVLITSGTEANVAVATGSRIALEKSRPAAKAKTTTTTAPAVTTTTTVDATASEPTSSDDAAVTDAPEAPSVLAVKLLAALGAEDIRPDDAELATWIALRAAVHAVVKRMADAI